MRRFLLMVARPYAEIGARLFEARTALGLTQPEVAALAGVSARTYQYHERGQKSPHRVLLNYSVALGRPVQWFHGDSASVTPEAAQSAAERRVALARVRRMEKDAARLQSRLQSEIARLQGETG